MHHSLLRLASVVVLLIAQAGWACSPSPLTGSKGTAPSVLPTGEVRLKGELRYYRCIDPVTGRGAVALHADGKDYRLDFRQFKLDILLPSGTYEVKGCWSKEQRLVVTAARPLIGRTALRS